MHPAVQHLPIISSAIILFTLVVCFILTYALHHNAIDKDNDDEKGVKFFAKVFVTGKYFPESVIFSYLTELVLYCLFVGDMR